MMRNYFILQKFAHDFSVTVNWTQV